MITGQENEMPTVTLYATACVWGVSSFDSTNGLNVGLMSSGQSNRGRLTFAAIPKSWAIRSIVLKLWRTDTYNSHTLLFGCAPGTGFNTTLSVSANAAVSDGTGSKSIDLTAFAAVIRQFGKTWYIHLRHGSGSNSYSEFTGNEGSTARKPQLFIEYVEAAVWYNNGGTWQKCLVYYCNNGTWVQCLPYYNSGGTWKPI